MPDQTTAAEYQEVVTRYHLLVDRKYIQGLTTAEAEEIERLRQAIDAHNAPFYEPIIRRLEEESNAGD